jgi:hypothetical protein
VKDTRELGCVPCLGEENVEVAGYWVRKVERVINQMSVLEKLQVDYVNSWLKFFLNTKIEINEDYNMPKSI